MVLILSLSNVAADLRSRSHNRRLGALSRDVRRGCSITPATWGRFIEIPSPPARCANCMPKDPCLRVGAEQRPHEPRQFAQFLRHSWHSRHLRRAARVTPRRATQIPSDKVPPAAQRTVTVSVQSLIARAENRRCRLARRGASTAARAASHSLTNGAVPRLTVTGLAHFVMRCDIAAPRSRANLLILQRLVPPLTIILAMPPDGISIANPKPSKAVRR
jgi:hypothetical protein